MTLRIGFIGAGGVSHEYRQRLDHLGERVAITAVCDIDHDRAARVAEPSGAAVYTDWRVMFAHEQLDAVFDNLPPFARGDELATAAERGLHVFTTKPLGLSLDAPLRTIAAIERAGVINSVGHMFRYATTIDHVRELLAGRPVQLMVAQALGANPVNWQAVRSGGGGQLVEHSVHLIDVMRLLAGDVARASGFGTSSPKTRFDYPDSTTVVMQHARGAVSTVASSCALDRYFWGLTVVANDLRLEVLFDHGTVTGVADGSDIDFRGGSAGYQEQIDAFIGAVESGDQSRIRSSYRDGVNTLAATLAATEAVDAGRLMEPERI